MTAPTFGLATLARPSAAPSALESWIAASLLALTYARERSPTLLA